MGTGIMDQMSVHGKRSVAGGILIYCEGSIFNGYFFLGDSCGSWTSIPEPVGRDLWMAGTPMEVEKDPHEKPGIYRVMASWAVHQEIIVKANSWEHAEELAQEECNVHDAVRLGLWEGTGVDWDGDIPDPIEA